MTPTDETPIIFADRVQSLNYDGPDIGEVFADAGTSIDLATGTITSTALVVDGITGSLSVRGDVTADSFTILDSLGNTSAIWATNVDAFGPYPLDGLMFSFDTWRTGILSGQAASGSIPGYIAMEAQNSDGRTARVFAFNEQVALEAFNTASAGSTLYLDSGSGGITLNSGTGTIVTFGAGLTVNSPLSATGAITGDLNVTARSTLVPIVLGAWDVDASWRGVRAASGYLLLGRNGAVSNIFLRTKSTAVGMVIGTGDGVNDTVLVRGSDGLFTATAFIQDLNMPATGTVVGYQEVYRSNTTGILHRFTSNRALKDRIETLDPETVGRIVDGLDPVSFVERPNPADSPEAAAWRAADLAYGFIAEDVFDLDPHLSTVEVADGAIVPNGWSSRPMIAVAMAELKALRARVAALESAA